MKKEDLYNAISELDPELIRQAEKGFGSETIKEEKRMRRSGAMPLILRYAAVAAAAVLLITLGAVVGQKAWNARTDGVASVAENDGVGANAVTGLNETKNDSANVGNTADAEDKSVTSVADAEDNTASSIQTNQQEYTASTTINLSCFNAPGKTDVISLLQTEADSYLDACKSGTLAEFAIKYPATVEAFRAYEPIIMSSIRSFDAELVYLWLYPERFEEIGKDVLLIGIRTRYPIPEFYDNLNSGEWEANPEYRPMTKTDWIYSFGYFYTYDANTGECIRMDTLRKNFSTTIRVLVDRSLSIMEQTASTDENDSSVVWYTQMEKIISFDEEALPVLEENLPVFKYANQLSEDDEAVYIDRDEFEKRYPTEEYPENMRIIDERIVAHGGEIGDVEENESVEFGRLTFDE